MNAAGIELDEEDAKLVTLARGARGRIGAAEGAALRDELGRTYAGATVATESLALSALQLAVASAIAAGARGAEAAVIVLESPPTPCASEPVTGSDAQGGSDSAPICASGPVTGPDAQTGSDSAPICASEPVTGSDALREVGGPGIPIYLCRPDGTLVSVVRT